MDTIFTYKIEGTEVSKDVYYNIVNFMFVNAFEDGKTKWNFKEETVRYIDKLGKTNIENHLRINDYSSMKKLFFDIINTVDISTLFEVC